VGADVAASGAPEWGGPTGPLAGTALLDRLRMTGRARPTVDPAFVADLRAYLDEGLTDVVVGPDRLVITRDRLTQVLLCPSHRSPDRCPTHVIPARPAAHREAPGRSFNLGLACGALVGALFRQIVATGAVADPMGDALDALGLDGYQTPLVAWVEGLDAAERSALRAEVERQAEGLVARWPSFDPSWLPRTDQSARAPLAGGSVELRSRVDFAVGRPDRSSASVALVDVVTGARRPEHREARHFDALVETLRGHAPPFATATYLARTGELDVDPVDHELLATAARRTLSGIRQVLGVEAPAADGTSCAVCRTLLVRPAVVVAVGAPTPVATGRPESAGAPDPLGAVATFPEEVAA